MPVRGQRVIEIARRKNLNSTTPRSHHRYGTSCTRKGCVYRHPPKPPKKVHVPKTSEICVHYVSGCCSFAEKCHMRHPGKAEAQKFRETCASIACRFGVDCANPNCLYDHTGSGRTSGGAAASGARYCSTANCAGR